MNNGTMTTKILGVPIDRVTEQQAIAHVIQSLDRRSGGSLVTLNLEMLRLCKRSTEARALVRAGSLLVADGQPLVWASRWQGEPLPERVTGSNLIWTLTDQVAPSGYSIFLLGGHPGAAETAAAKLRAATPGLRVAGCLCPPRGFEHVPSEMDDISRVLASSRPDIVYVGLGFPKQERLISQLCAELPSTWFVGVGISIDFVAGRVRRAPRWIQSLGLEWLHRLAQEPRRLVKRYLVHGLAFMPVLFADSLRVRLRRRARRRKPSPRTSR